VSIILTPNGTCGIIISIDQNLADRVNIEISSPIWNLSVGAVDDRIAKNLSLVVAGGGACL
jgi:hypothetical protein